MLSPLLYSLFTHDFSPGHPSNSVIKFADDITIVGRISGGNKTAYCDKAGQLSVLRTANNRKLNQLKTQEAVVDCRGRKKTVIQPLYIDGACVERVFVFPFLGIHIEEGLSWRANTTAIIKKAQQRLYFLRILRNYHLRQEMLVSLLREQYPHLLHPHNRREESAPDGRQLGPKDPRLPSPPLE